MKGVITKKNADIFTINSDGRIVEIKARGKIKKEGLYVGDYVEFSDGIDKVYPRKNFLIRPPLANLDKLFIVVSPLPKPDFLLVDKIILYCFIKGIEPVLLINKIDIADDKFTREIKKIYKKVLKVHLLTAKEDNFEIFNKLVEGNCALAGQSAVGKSSLINSVFGENFTEVGDLSKKIARGKQTTRLVSLYPLEKGFLADTAGFSMLELGMIMKRDYRELSSYYPDFLEFRKFCKFRTCLHQNSQDCAIIKAVNEGKISSLRYQNYLKLLQELKSIKTY